ncbi:putative ntf2 and rrm domain-containing protein [Phaeoacremonium minimum UCRPA7]|uniref:Putative ntf2 and rrm domain-containing protein n=1 Tax=Phaeoacremonium minimum (strain UCR-PA7) TaxID=1286976 RepID=R8BYL7_PHAM7|nr:putative ntf2 and rrm domain-containing protein [Phaeoacremonium minimum UCRPA7]EOO04442.1 putative ntf2 and rrm domain-containing protein [Phaeoacremonium minimum UCRPA7]
MATNGNTNHQGPSDQYTASSAAIETSGGSNPNSNLSKDEVGWYFVEQYYTTLSKSPEKLHLFYGKRSQFVYGLEAEVANVSVGRQAIQDRIKQLDFQDCKVRISNVDSQASFDNIVIQVIGETSNKSGEPKKFVQTFVLAQQPSGYFVLNDILRYVNEENDEEPIDPVAQDAPVAESEIAEKAPVSIEAEAPKIEETEQEKPLDPTVVDKKLEEVTKEAPPSFTAETPAEPAAAAEEPSSKPAAVDPEKAVQEVAEEDTKKPETPKDPSPTPVVTRPPAPAATEPEKPKEPAKPMTWASRAAAAAGTPRAIVPLPKTATPPAQPKPATPTAATPQTSAPAQPTESTPPSSKESAGEWQTAGADSKRQNRPQSISAPPPEKEGTMGYVKYVTEKVKADDLKAALASYGELIYFDINRSKNCAFVEFATTAGYQAAAAASPHVVNGENIVVEPRRPKASAYGGANYNSGRGSISGGRGRGGFEGGRSGSQGGGRGGFTGQNRGRGGGARGRGTSQAANA